MYNCSISLENFRNFEDFKVNFTDKAIVIHGENGSGKTSLLEAIYYIFYGVSFRDRDISALINHRADYSRIKLTINNMEVSAYIDRSGNRRVFLNGESILRSVLRKDFIPIYSIGKDNLLDGAMSDRRRIIDKLAVLSYRGFRKVLTDYERIARNKKEAIIKKDVSTLAAVNEKFYELYSIIYEARSKVIDKLSLVAERLGFNMQFTFRPSIMDFSQIEEVLPEEFEVGQMLKGSNFDIIEIEFNDVDARKFLSHGEKQYLWYLLFFEFIKDLSNQQNRGILMLMDEAFSVLDDTRIKMLIENVLSGSDKVIYFFTTQRKLSTGVSYLYLDTAYGRVQTDS